MSLLSDSMQTCYILAPTRTEDGESGFVTSYAASTSVLAAIVNSTSSNARTAEKQNSKNEYLCIVPKSVVLDYHTILQRAADNAYFRITSDKGQHDSPQMSGLGISLYTAEEWEMID